MITSEAIIEYGAVGAFHCKDIFDLKGNCKPEDVHTLQCQVDTTESSLSFIGDRFPNLQKLKLNNSIIPNMRDIGCRFTNLKFLSLARCGITSLNGISTISQVLEELYLAFNQIDDCSELVGMDSLVVIDLEENNISDLSNIEFLSTCSNLKSLTLSGNPCVDDPETYRSKVRNLLPKLRYLDEKRLQPKETKPNPRSARIKNEITYKTKKIQPKEPENNLPKETEKVQEKGRDLPNGSNSEKDISKDKEKHQPKEPEAKKPQVNQKGKPQIGESGKEKSHQTPKVNVQPKESQTEKTQAKSNEKVQPKESQAAKTEAKPNEKIQPKESQPAKTQTKPNEKVQSKQKEKQQIKEPEQEKSQPKGSESEKVQIKQKGKLQPKQKGKNQTKESESEKISSKPREKVQSKTDIKKVPKEQDKNQSNSEQKKVQIIEPEEIPKPSTSFQVTEPPAPPPQETFKVKEPQYENDDEVIITEMLDDLIEDRPPTARGNYESKFFKDSFELQQRYKTPIALKTKPHVITPRVPRNKKPRAISSVKKLA